MPDNENPEESSERESHTGDSDSALAHAAMVSSPPDDVHRHAKVPPSGCLAPDSQLWSRNTNPSEPSQVGRLSHFRRALTSAGISAEAEELLSASWRKRTNKKYESA